ncbi:MAG TPA: hypothetical protein VG734_23130 [Lacunisphaera sp.]|nr:hypothetical protein [Lacunisphaera sp.]
MAAKKTSKKPAAKPQGPPDVNTLAVGILAAVTGGARRDEPMPGKNPAAVALGKLGGAKGGKARAAKLSPTQRKEIASAAAVARWKRSP